MTRVHTDSTIRWLSRTILPPGNLTSLRRAIAGTPHGVMLESVAQDRTFGRFSIYAWDAVRIITTVEESERNIFGILRDQLCPAASFDSPPELPFVGGWIGYLAYECGGWIEPTARHNPSYVSRFPMARWMLVDTVVVFDRLRDAWHVAGVELPARLRPAARPPLADRLDVAESFVANSDVDDRCEHAPVPDSFPSVRAKVHPAGQWAYSQESYFERVRRVLEYIRAGDVFQVNLARGYQAPVAEAPIAVYERLCCRNPSIYAAYLSVGPDMPGAAILSSSPELFLSLRGRRVMTRPIKGTRPRGGDADADRLAAEELSGCVKDRAELNMIIDLERNDLGRVCEYGSVRVLDDGCIERHPTVLHRTASITGILRPEANAIDLLRATFPGGSITGAPKVRAMQIINELEPGPRGPYCGAIGYLGLDGDLQLNLAIRTLTIADQVAELFVGSGLVADSVPEEELAELEAKAAGMLAALSVDVRVTQTAAAMPVALIPVEAPNG